MRLPLGEGCLACKGGGPRQAAERPARSASAPRYLRIGLFVVCWVVPSRRQPQGSTAHAKNKPRQVGPQKPPRKQHMQLLQADMPGKPATTTWLGLLGLQGNSCRECEQTTCNTNSLQHNCSQAHRQCAQQGTLCKQPSTDKLHRNSRVSHDGTAAQARGCEDYCCCCGLYCGPTPFAALINWVANELFWHYLLNLPH